jgi:hypothetical protein
MGNHSEVQFSNSKTIQLLCVSSVTLRTGMGAVQNLAASDAFRSAAMWRC